MSRRCATRHWFAVGTGSGVQAPECLRCGAPHPRYTEQMRKDYDEFVADEARERNRGAMSPLMRQGEVAMTLFWRLAWTQYMDGRHRQAAENMDVALRVIGMPWPSGQRARRQEC